MNIVETDIDLIQYSLLYFIIHTLKVEIFSCKNFCNLENQI